MVRVVSWPDRSRFAWADWQLNNGRLLMSGNRLPAKLPHRIRNLSNGVTAQLGIHRQLQDFTTNFFSLRQIALAVAEIAKPALQVHWNWIVNPGADSVCVEMLSQLIALFTEQRKNMIDRFVAGRFFKQPHSGISERTRVSLSVTAPRVSPFIKML